MDGARGTLDAGERRRARATRGSRGLVCSDEEAEAGAHVRRARPLLGRIGSEVPPVPAPGEARPGRAAVALASGPEMSVTRSRV